MTDDAERAVAGALDRAAAALARAQALVVTAGAGMGVDSGLPDFRGPAGFWRAYPAYQALGLSFEDLANPRWFDDDPTLAWGFYGHRLNLYRRTTPHAGFGVLRALADRMAQGAFVFTSNVDGHFQKAGFPDDRVCEVHGAIGVLQCTKPSCLGLFAPPAEDIVVDERTFRAAEPLPRCPRCGRLARPNILMFYDMGWDERRSEQQGARLEDWRRGVEAARAVVVECGAGTSIPTVRGFSERWLRQGATLLRINVREADGPPGVLSVPLGARAALERLSSRLIAEV